MSIVWYHTLANNWDAAASPLTPSYDVPAGVMWIQKEGWEGFIVGNKWDSFIVKEGSIYLST